MPPPPHLFRTVVPPIVLPVFLAAADGTIVATALPAIAAAFGNVEYLSWIVVANLVASTIAAPAYGRLGDAFLHTIWRHNDSGGMMPAYSEFLGDYGAAALSRLWWPEKYHRGTAIFVAGSDTILIDAAINAFHEFKPDIKRWLHLAH